MEASSLLQLPKEIRLCILEYLVETSAVKCMDWFNQPTFKICQQLQDDAVAVVYRTRDYIFELPDFTP